MWVVGWLLVSGTLAAEPIRNTGGRWSPDGRRIVFASDRNGSREIFLTDAAGSPPVRLTSGANPTFSPDGRFIAFDDAGEEAHQIYLLDLTTGARRGLTTGSLHRFAPHWSPDGERLTYSGYPTAGQGNDGWIGDVWVMRADGGGHARLTSDAANEDWSVWSPDGRRLAFGADRDGVYGVFVMDADGAKARRLSRGADSAPSWSPEGTRIAFHSTRDGDDNFEIYVMNADGSGQRRLTRNPASDLQPAWSPDGRQILFSSAREGRHLELWLMRADGSEKRRLTVSGNGS